MGKRFLIYHVRQNRSIRCRICDSLRASNSAPMRDLGMPEIAPLRNKTAGIYHGTNTSRGSLE